ncbi:hypothetical protein [Halogeometricum limi]|nr:hypothetical protein [Halogeometricum limi]
MVLQPSASLSVALLFGGGVVAGVAATLAMDAVTGRIEEGETPPRIASGVLTGQHPDFSSRRLAAVVHYVAGALTGPLFVWVLLVTTGVFGNGLVSLAAAAVVCYPLMVGFFALVVLPRAKGLDRRRMRRIRRAWTVEAAVYLLVVTPLVGVAAAMV